MFNDVFSDYAFLNNKKCVILELKENVFKIETLKI
jgi:hypothetical protein